ncbi:MAG TPA: hypothetical protein VJY47_04270 [Candidatus Dojkabacteria bacterium]|nr:hypothetical protein [Candidatus Dojkabacteria bacterium]
MNDKNFLNFWEDFCYLFSPEIPKIIVLNYDDKIQGIIYSPKEREEEVSSLVGCIQKILDFECEWGEEEDSYLRIFLSYTSKEGFSCKERIEFLESPLLSVPFILNIPFLGVIIKHDKEQKDFSYRLFMGGRDSRDKKPLFLKDYGERFYLRCWTESGKEGQKLTPLGEEIWGVLRGTLSATLHIDDFWRTPNDTIEIKFEDGANIPKIIKVLEVILRNIKKT